MGDLDFEDGWWYGAPSKTTPTSGSFHNSSSATTGSTRMRISMNGRNTFLL
jgi:hypothetical protein